MRRTSLVSFALAAALCVAPSAAAAETARGETLALAALVEGDCSVRLPSATDPVPLRLLDRIPRASLLETGRESRLVVVYLTGARFEVGPDSAAVVEDAAPRTTRGETRPLAPVSPKVALAPLAASLEGSRRAGAVRVRGDGAFSMYPSESAALAARDAVLRFSPVPGAERYAVAVEDEATNTVFSAQTAATRVALPQAVLREGATYFWRVRARGPGLSGIGREERFVTLSPADARRWDEARAGLSAADPSLGSLLAAAASSLGLRREACLAAASAGGSAGSAWAASLRCEALAPFLGGE